ncbi:MAG: hypothetical protein ABL998_23500 [Planctomycetota bacterium]
MKPITLHPLSVLAGIALAGVLFVVSGAAQSHGTLQPIPSHDIRVVSEVPAEWWTFIRLDSSSPYTVPSDRFLVVTRVTGSDASQFRKNGATWQVELQPVLGNFSNFPNPWTDVGNTRVVAQPGDVLTLQATGGEILSIWGYLEPVR